MPKFELSERQAVPTPGRCGIGWNGTGGSTWNTTSSPIPKPGAGWQPYRGQRTVPVLVEDGKVVQIGWQGRGCVVNAE